jgi:antitoxin component HigA of HigAB toxin-antitoxin module
MLNKLKDKVLNVISPIDFYQKPDMCIYHKNCLDGIMAAWAVNHAFPRCEWWCPADYHDDTYPDVANKHVVIVDFHYKRHLLIEMAKVAKTITIVDHHITAENELVNLPRNVRVIIDIHASGAVLAWEWAHPFTGVPDILRHVQDADLFKFKLSGTYPIVTNLYSHLWTFTNISDLADDLDGVLKDGYAIVRYRNKVIASLLNLSDTVNFHGWNNIPFAVVPREYRNEVGDNLAYGHPFSITAWPEKDKLRISMRSQKDGGADVEKIALEYGGGGHKHAAGFTIPLKQEQTINYHVKTILEQTKTIASGPTISITNLEPFIKLPLEVVDTSDFNFLSEMLEGLIDRVGEDENHILTPLLTMVGDLVSDYEKANYKEPVPPHAAVLTMLMTEHKLTKNDFPEIGDSKEVEWFLREGSVLQERQIELLTKRFGIHQDSFDSLQNFYKRGYSSAYNAIVNEPVPPLVAKDDFLVDASKFTGFYRCCRAMRAAHDYKTHITKNKDGSIEWESISSPGMPLAIISHGELIPTGEKEHNKDVKLLFPDAEYQVAGGVTEETIRDLIKSAALQKLKTTVGNSDVDETFSQEGPDFKNPVVDQIINYFKIEAENITNDEPAISQPYPSVEDIKNYANWAETKATEGDKPHEKYLNTVAAMLVSEAAALLKSMVKDLTVFQYTISGAVGDVKEKLFNTDTELMPLLEKTQKLSDNLYNGAKWFDDLLQHTDGVKEILGEIPDVLSTDCVETVQLMMNDYITNRCHTKIKNKTAEPPPVYAGPIDNSDLIAMLEMATKKPAKQEDKPDYLGR